MAQPFDPSISVLQAGAGRSGDTESDAFGTILCGDSVQLTSNRVERRIPTDALPARISFAFGPRSAQRVEQPLVMMHQLWRCATLAAECLAGRM